MPSYVVLGVGLAIYSAFAYYLRFTQDDAFITYRYVANSLDGYGLVYNIGERVCGFTNFGWTVYLALWGALGFDFIAVSKITGFLLGGGVIWVTYLLGRRHFSGYGIVGIAFPVLLLGANLSLAYWSPAGLETAAFAFAVALTLHWFLSFNRLLALGIAMSVWLRPEGAVIAGLLILIEVLIRRSVPRFTLRASAIAFLLSLPYVLFMYFYYGSILPNPFYAKTAFGWEQLSAGLGYSWLFLKHYGFLGAPILAGLLLWRRISLFEKQLLLFVVGYSLYIIVIGGDVLKVHRFFVPVLAPYALLTAGLSIAAFRHLRPVARTLSLGAVLVGALAWVVLIPWKYTVDYNTAEKGLVTGMSKLARGIAEADDRSFSVAVTTIGAFGYELRDHTVIDMLGLTDSTVARHPQPPVAGVSSTWRESKYNAPYVLGRQPDYIVFSTGMKPSAPAEKVLLLCPEFLRAYRAVTFPQPRDPASGNVMLDIAYRRVRPIPAVGGKLLPAEFVESFTRGQRFYSVGSYDSARYWLERAQSFGDSARPYPELTYLIAGCKVAMGDAETGYDMLNRIVADDSLMYNAHLALYMTEIVRGNKDKAAVHRRFVAEFSPGQVPILDSSVAVYLSASGRK